MAVLTTAILFSHFEPELFKAYTQWNCHKCLGVDFWPILVYFSFLYCKNYVC